jgi:hypothetical protein
MTNLTYLKRCYVLATKVLARRLREKRVKWVLKFHPLTRVIITH